MHHHFAVASELGAGQQLTLILKPGDACIVRATSTGDACDRHRRLD